MIDKDEILLEEKQSMSCRDVLWYLIFSGFAINYMLRINLSLAIIAMVEPRTEAVAMAQCSQDMEIKSMRSDVWIYSLTLTNTSEHDVSRNRSEVSLKLLTTSKNQRLLNGFRYSSARLSWGEYEQGLALAGYYLLYWAVQLPGDSLARRYGTKFIFGWSNLSNALIGFVLPAAARLHLYVFVFFRIFQGLTAGVIWSAMHTMIAKWIPPNEISRFHSCYYGCSVGLALTYPLSALLIDWFGWSSVFYVTSALGVVWYFAWNYLAYDTPHKHPRISNVEKSYILECQGNSANHGGSRVVPWKEIITSAPVWLLTINCWGSTWGIHTLNSEAPSYFNYVHGWTVGSASLLSALPHVARMFFAYASSICAERILRTKKMSKTKLSKTMTLVTSCLHSFLMLGLAHSGCHPTLAVIFMISAMAFSGGVSNENFPCFFDLSPKYGNIVMGFSNTLTSSAGLISPLIVGYLTENNQTIHQWRLVFIITGLITLSTCVIFTLFGTTELQPWNDPINEEKGEELQTLSSSADKVEPEKSIAILMDNEIVLTT